MAEDTGKRRQHALAKADASAGINGLKPRNTVGRIGLLQFLRPCHLVTFRGTLPVLALSEILCSVVYDRKDESTECS